MQRYARIIQLIGESDIPTISPYGIVQVCVVIEHTSGDDQIQARLLQDVHLIPAKNIFLPMFHRFYFRTLSMYGETHS